MKQIFFFLILFLTVNCFAQEKLLFDGNSSNQWYAFEPVRGKMTDAGELFRFEEGLIRLDGKKPGYLMSIASFRNFTLRAEYRWNMDTTVVAASKKKNSGIMYLVPEETPDELWPKGIQFQIKEGATGDFVLLKEVTLKVNAQVSQPGNSVVVTRTIDAEKPFGEWNSIEITCKNGHVVQKLNGMVVNEGTESSVLRGRILLQYEGYPIDFRNITITQ